LFPSLKNQEKASDAVSSCPLKREERGEIGTYMDTNEKKGIEATP
jgi:hypothetical protein